jgi:hypothetical protein
MLRPWYATKDGISLYDIFGAGVLFGRVHGYQYTEDEWYAALERSLPADFLAKLKAGK